MSQISRKKKMVFTLLLSTAVLVMGLGSGEIYIRWSRPYTTPAIRRQHSPQFVASLFARNVFPQEPQNLTINKWKVNWYINEHGYRGRDFSVAKPAGTRRIIFYGGSSVFDFYNSQGQDWPHRVENLLRSDGLPELEVINAGIPGHASFDSFGRLFAEGHTFKPDYVVLYNAWNDIKYFGTDEPLLRHFKPYQKGRDPRVYYQGTIDRLLCEHSQLFVVLRDSYYKWKYQITLEGTTPQGEGESEGGEYVEKISAAALTQYRLNVLSFVDCARNIGATPILLTQARLIAPDNSEKDMDRIDYDLVQMDHYVLCEAFAKIDETLQQIAREKNVLLIDASTPLTGKGEFFVDHVHLNEKGSAELAKFVASQLKQVLLAERK